MSTFPPFSTIVKKMTKAARDHVRKLRKGSDLCQIDITKTLSISQTSYSKHQIRENIMSPTIMIKLAVFAVA